ncbi:MAG TPA: Ig-like domain-containing protein [Candidatus Angelobacter sp.]|nr:Ig-like domain-containing protein [Candidatus Angelobacter sp.]
MTGQRTAETRSFHRIRVWIAAAIVTAMMSISGCSNSAGTGSPPSLTSIDVTPMNPTIVNGNQQQFKATGHYSDGTTQDLTASVTWSSSDQNVATISAGGLATTVGTGTSTIKAVSGSLPGSTLLTVTPSGAPVPTLVQHVSGSNNRGNSFASPFCYHIQLPGGTTAGNAVIVGFTFKSNVTPHITDDKNDSYSREAHFFDAADSQSIDIFASFNVAAGARQINVCFASDPGGFVQPTVSEFANVTGMDVVSAGASGSGTAITAGSMTPTVTGDLSYAVTYGLGTNQDQTSFTPGSQSSITWQLASADLLDGFAVQYGVYNSASAINPAMSMGTSKPWLAVAALFRSGQAGSVPSGMRIVHMDHENIPTKTSAGGNGNNFPNPLTVQFPCSGNLGVITVGGGNPPAQVFSIADTNNNTWKLAGSYAVTNDPVAGIFYAASANCSGPQKLTVNWSANTGDQTILYYDVAGASASPLDTPASMTGNQGSVGNLTVLSITPTTSSTELIFCATPIQYNTVNGLVNGFIDSNIFDGENINGPEPVDENNGWGHFVTSSTNPISVTWTFLPPAAPAQEWAAAAAAFK